MSILIRKSILVIGERGRGGVLMDGPQIGPEIDGKTPYGFIVGIFRVRHTDGGRREFERQCDRRGVNFRRVRDDSTSTYEVWGPDECLSRLSREKVVVNHGGITLPDGTVVPGKERNDNVTFGVDGSVPGYQSPTPFGRQFRK